MSEGDKIRISWDDLNARHEGGPLPKAYSPPQRPNAVPHTYPPPPPPPLGTDPYMQRTPMPQKSKLAAGLFGIFLGGLGIHRFYLGYVGIGVAQIVVTLLTFGLGSMWGLVEGILILAGSIDKDAEGRPLKSDF
jgi:hypothetical protein